MQSQADAPDATATSACILCECNCGIEITLDGRRFKRIHGDEQHPASQGYTCQKALRLDHYQNNPDRITSPLRRRADGTYEEIDWDTAIDEIAAKLAAVRDTHGGDKIFFYGGGGQGNHLGGMYAAALQAAVGAKYYSNAIAQEKTGETWVDGKLYGGHTKGDFAHSEVVVFVGKNPWQSHSFPRARPTLKQIARDAARSMIVLDPRRSETAEMADFHLQVRPGTDAWCLAALLAVLVRDDLIDHEFIARHTSGSGPVLAALSAVPISDYAQRCGVAEELISAAAHRIGTASSVATYEDLGTQQGPHSTLVSYLNKLIWILTGNFGEPGTMFLHSSLVPLTGLPPSNEPQRAPNFLRDKAAGLLAIAAATSAAGFGKLVSALAGRRSTASATDRMAKAVLDRTAARVAAMAPAIAPGGTEQHTLVTKAPIIAGLVPCNSITEEILTDHPDRLRAMWIDANNPAHSLADSPRWRRAMRALDLTVVIDVALTETALLADYVLPASSQFEKWEASFFNFEFPHNVFQLRAPVLDPLPGTVSEPEIYARVIRALGVVGEDTIANLRAAARGGRNSFTLAFFSALAADPAITMLSPYLLYETLGPTLPDGAQSAAGLWVVAHLCALHNPHGVRGAGFTGPGFEPGEKLFEAILTQRSGITFTADEWSDVWNYVSRPDRRFTIEVPELLDKLAGIVDDPGVWTTDEFPLVLSAGERRAFTANTIIRDPAWRRRDPAGALRISPADAQSHGVTNGDFVRLVTERGAAEVLVEVSPMMAEGHISLPNGLGTHHRDSEGARVQTGVAPNDLTSVDRRDWLAGTPWHKNVPARIELAAQPSNRRSADEAGE
ncbi:molybdopterin-dependent oxidoreductase [Mycobacterium spongiae]|uniref:Molybdopterin-dependent oxidoreductase n=1 Tax=Mycobacterium spongiae TaxID=886343 RepID=A0A975K1W4_9MYCO|nr:molybdopterin-dependent oxidoreductase [Mycobacterium spongiae]QUR69834.1 molybdopterin-dependent oxidoreductase [Mycobacterium spongiae]